MLARLFRSNQPGVLVFLLVLVPALFLSYWGTQPPPMDQGMPLARLLARLFSTAGWAYGLLVMLLVALLGVQVAALMNETELADRRTHLAALLVPVVLALLLPPGAIGSALFGAPFVVWAMQRTWSISRSSDALSPLFDAGLLLGFAAQTYVPYAFLIVVVWASVSVIRPFNWKEYVVPLLGLVVVFYLAWGLLILMHIPVWSPLRTVSAAAAPRIALPEGYDWSLALVLVPVLVIAALRFAQHYGRGVVREQNVRSAFIALVLTLTLMAVFLWSITGLPAWEPIALPLAMLSTYAFLGTRRAWLGEVAVLCALLLACWLQYGRA